MPIRHHFEEKNLCNFWRINTGLLIALLGKELFCVKFMSRCQVVRTESKHMLTCAHILYFNLHLLKISKLCVCVTIEQHTVIVLCYCSCLCLEVQTIFHMLRPLFDSFLRQTLYEHSNQFSVMAVWRHGDYRCDSRMSLLLTFWNIISLDVPTIYESLITFSYLHLKSVKKIKLSFLCNEN